MSKEANNRQDRPAQLERCGSCNGVINPHNGDCRCS
jgi:hypothetical protein